MPAHSNYPCPYCQIGHCQPGQAAYVRIQGSEVISVPDMDVWTCDICGFQEFDREAILNIETLLAESSLHETLRTKNPDVSRMQRMRRAKP